MWRGKPARRQVLRRLRHRTWAGTPTRRAPSDARGKKRFGSGGAAAPAIKDDNPAQAPKVDLPQSEADLPPDTGADLEMRIRNNSTIVDAYGIESAWAPKWLTITHPEIRLMPGESDSVTAHLAIAAGAVVEAQTLTPRLRIYSQRDTSKFVEVTVKLTVPRYGPPLTIRARPPVVRLVNNTSGRVEVTLDNAGSNYPRRAALAASDSEGVVQFRISPPTAVVPPGGHATANVDFNVPAVRDGENRVRQLTISAREEENTAEAAVTVNQERIAAAPLRLRLEPSVLRIRDGDTAEADGGGRQPRSDAESRSAVAGLRSRTHAAVFVCRRRGQSGGGADDRNESADRRAATPAG